MQDIERQLRRTGRWQGTLSHATANGRRLVRRKAGGVLPRGSRLVREVNRNITARHQPDNDRAYLAAMLHSANDAVLAKTV